MIQLSTSFVAAALAGRIILAQHVPNGISTTVLPVVTVSSCPASELAQHTSNASQSIVPLVSTYITVCAQPVETGFIPATYTITETCPCHVGSLTRVAAGFTTAIASVSTETKLITCPVASLSAWIQSGFVQAPSSTGAGMLSANTGMLDSSPSISSTISGAAYNGGNTVALMTIIQTTPSPPFSTSGLEAKSSVVATSDDIKSITSAAAQATHSASDHAGSYARSVHSASSVHTGFSTPSSFDVNTTTATSSIAIYTALRLPIKPLLLFLRCFQLRLRSQSSRRLMDISL